MFLHVSSRPSEVFSIPKFTSVSFLKVLKGEHELFCRVFPQHNDDAAKSLTPFGESLGMLLLEIFRPRYIHLNNISVIADLIDTLRNQVLHSSIVYDFLCPFRSVTLQHS